MADKRNIVPEILSNSGATPEQLEAEHKKDNINHPSHYTWLKEKAGIEVIDITRWLPADISNAVKYLLRQGHKQEMGLTTKQKAIEDCRKAIWYINDYIDNVLK